MTGQTSSEAVSDTSCYGCSGFRFQSFSLFFCCAAVRDAALIAPCGAASQSTPWRGYTMGTPSIPVVGAHPYASVRWSAIIAGWMVATGVATLMYVAGLAFGFSVFDPYNAASSAKGVGGGTVIWIVLTWIVSLFLGGMFASWFDGKADQTVGTLHGVAVWGLAMTASMVLITLGATQALQGGAAVARAGAAAMGATPRGAAVRAPTTPQEDALTGLQAQLMLHVRSANNQTTGSAPASGGQPTTGPQPAPEAAAPAAPASQASTAGIRRASEQLDAQTMALVARALYRGDAEGAKALLAANTSLSQPQIDQAVRDISPQIEKAKSEVKAATDAAARYTAMAMWVVFFSILLALVAAAAGGWLGAGHIHRVYHLRRYETGTPPPL
jgi:hypothetical protein